MDPNETTTVDERQVLEALSAMSGETPEAADQSITLSALLGAEPLPSQAAQPEPAPAAPAEPTQEASPAEDAEHQGTGRPGAEEADLQNGFYKSQAEFDAAFSRRMSGERARNRPFVDIGRTITEVTGAELSLEDIRDIVVDGLAQRRAQQGSGDVETERRLIASEQRVMKRFMGENPDPNAEPPEQQESLPPQNDVVEARTREMIRDMDDIGDPRFTLDALLANTDAMARWASGATPLQVYNNCFKTAAAAAAPPSAEDPRPAPERRANSGATGSPAPRHFTAADYDAVDEALRAGKSIRLF